MSNRGHGQPKRKRNIYVPAAKTKVRRVPAATPQPTPQLDPLEIEQALPDGSSRFRAMGEHPTLAMLRKINATAEERHGVPWLFRPTTASVPGKSAYDLHPDVLKSIMDDPEKRAKFEEIMSRAVETGNVKVTMTEEVDDA